MAGAFPKHRQLGGAVIDIDTCSSGETDARMITFHGIVGQSVPASCSLRTRVARQGMLGYELSSAAESTIGKCSASRLAQSSWSSVV